MIKKNGGIFGRNPTYNDVVVEGVLTLKEAQVFDNDITINGDLTVNGTETVINTVELNVDDKNITMGAVVAKVGLAATTNITAGQFTVQLADTSGLIPGMTVTKTSGTGAFGASPKIASVDSHTQITLTVAHATSGTIIFDTGGATDDTADGGGITLKGLTDKFIKWVKSTGAWTFSDKIEAPDATITGLTASKPVFTDANKKLTSTGTLAIDQGGTGSTTAADARTALGLGTMATQAANNVAITGGSATGLTSASVDNITVDGNTISSTDANGNINLSPNGTGLVTGKNAFVKFQLTDGSNGSPVTEDGFIFQRLGGTGRAGFKFTNRYANNGTQEMAAWTTDTTGTYAQRWKIDWNGFYQWGPGNQYTYDYGNGVGPQENHFKISSGNTGLGFATSSNTQWLNFFNLNQLSVPDNIARIEVTATSTGNTVEAGYMAIYTRSGAGSTASLKTIQFEANGDITASRGNFVVGASGKGIDFSATSDPAAGMTSELFADYEEGTWTPTLRFGAGSTGITYTTQQGRYTKVGRTVTIRFEIALSSKGTSTGECDITGLPYAAANLNAFSVYLYANFNATYKAGIAYLNSSTINEIAANGTAAFSDAQFTNTSRFWGTCTYQV